MWAVSSRVLLYRSRLAGIPGSPDAYGGHMTHPTSPNDPVGPQAVSPEVSPGSPPQEGLGAEYPQSAAWSDDAAQPG